MTDSNEKFMQVNDLTNRLRWLGVDSVEGSGFSEGSSTVLDHLLQL